MGIECLHGRMDKNIKTAKAHAFLHIIGYSDFAGKYKKSCGIPIINSQRKL